MTKQKENSRKELWYFLLLIVIVFILWIISWYLLDKYITKENLGLSEKFSNSDEELRGVFGDKFGAINALFSAFAFAGIILTIILQKQELKLQRNELASTREVFEKQNAMLSLEKFENTYFQLLSLFHSIVNSLDLRRNGDVIKSGRDCFETFYNEFISKVDYIISRENNKKDLIFEGYIGRGDLSKELYIEAYNSVYIKHRSDLSHYFRTFYHLIKLIDKSDINDKNQYTSIARAQLSSYEQVLLFYNCLHGNGKEKFKPLIEKYCLLKNIDRALLISETNMIEYNESAFVKAK